MTIYRAVILLWLASEVLIGISHLAPAGARRQDRFSGFVLVVCAVISTFGGVLVARGVPAAAITTGGAAVFALGIAIALAGIALRWYAVLTLGRFFTTRIVTTKDQTVVARGPYRLIRHPSYTGALITVLGILLCQMNWLSFALFGIVVAGLAYRIKVEERALIDGLGQPYIDYMRRTKRLVPFVV